MLWHHNARVNSHQRWKQTRLRVCFHLWCKLTKYNECNGVTSFTEFMTIAHIKTPKPEVAQPFSISLKMYKCPNLMQETWVQIHHSRRPTSLFDQWDTLFCLIHQFYYHRNSYVFSKMYLYHWCPFWPMRAWICLIKHLSQLPKHGSIWHAWMHTWHKLVYTTVIGGSKGEGRHSPPKAWQKW